MKYIIIILLFIIGGCNKIDEVTKEVIPLPPSQLKAAIISNDRIELTWKDNSTNESGFKIERKTESGIFLEIGETAKDITVFSDKSLSLNTNYIYRIYSFNQTGKSLNYSNEFSIKTPLLIPSLTTNSVSEISTNSAKSGGTISSDGGSPILSKGIVWDIKSNPTISITSKTNEGAGLGPFVSLITGVASSTTYYVRAYATNIAGTAYGNEITFNTVQTTTFIYNTVTSKTGRIWLDRNLGATQVATSPTDPLAYGNLYQWGRGTDGHELRTSGVITTLPINNNSWQGVNGESNPCPLGFRIPTEIEWEEERATWISNNSNGAFSSSLKLTQGGRRFYNTGLINNLGTEGFYWSSTLPLLNAGRAYYMLIFSSNAYINWDNPATGVSVRCIKN